MSLSRCVPGLHPIVIAVTDYKQNSKAVPKEIMRSLRPEVLGTSVQTSPPG